MSKYEWMVYYTAASCILLDVIIIISSLPVRQWFSSSRSSRTFPAVPTFAFSCQILLLTSILFMFLFIVSWNRSLGLSWFHFPFKIWEYRICRGRRSWSILSSCPSHHRFICLRLNFRDDSPALFRTSSLLILSLYAIPMLDVKCLITYACSLLVCTLYIVHVSAPYNKAASTVAW